MKSKYLNSVLILALFTMVITLSAFFSISEAAGFADASMWKKLKAWTGRKAKSSRR